MFVVSADDNLIGRSAFYVGERLKIGCMVHGIFSSSSIDPYSLVPAKYLSAPFLAGKQHVAVICREKLN